MNLAHSRKKKQQINTVQNFQRQIIILTPESSVHILDSPQDLTAASILNIADRCLSGPELLDGSGWISKLRPESHH